MASFPSCQASSDLLVARVEYVLDRLRAGYESDHCDPGLVYTRKKIVCLCGTAGCFQMIVNEFCS